MAKVELPKKILLIDDDKNLTEILAMKLEQRGYSVNTANSGEIGLTLACKDDYDSIVLDLNMPGKDGFSVCHELRAQGVITPILVLSGVTAKGEIVHALECGADEYLTKPFDGDELSARLRALIRRNGRLFAAAQLQVGGVTLLLQERRVVCGRRSINLTPTETTLLSRLMQHSPESATRQTLFKEVWNIDDVHTSNRLDAYVKRLRGKLQHITPHTLIHTVHSGGYYFGAKEK
jgi:DNA-binding response OmpR family regulator